MAGEPTPFAHHCGACRDNYFRQVKGLHLNESYIWELLPVWEAR